MREALKFYADQKNWIDDTDDDIEGERQPIPWTSKIENDRGRIAKQVLTPSKEK